MNRGRVEEDTAAAVGGPQGCRGHLQAGAGTVGAATCRWARLASRPALGERGLHCGKLRVGAAAAWPATGGRRWGGGRRNHEIEAESQERFPFCATWTRGDRADRAFLLQCGHGCAASGRGSQGKADRRSDGLSRRNQSFRVLSFGGRRILFAELDRTGRPDEGEAKLCSTETLSSL